MTYRLRRGTSAELRRVVRKEIAKAVQDMRAPARQTRAVHQARKRLKKIRAVLRLVREELGGAVYGKENRALRNAAQSLSGQRDFQVQLQALEKLRRHFPRGEAPPIFPVSRRVIIKNWKNAPANGRRSTSRAARTAELEAARRRVKKWPVGHLRWTDFGRGLKELYRRGRKAFRVAEADPTMTNLHVCRKRVKDLWYVLGLLESACPSFMSQAARRAKVLGELLGTDHDLAILEQSLRAKLRAQASAADRARLFGAIKSQRAELQASAIKLGRRFYAEKPSHFARRLDRHCKPLR